MKFGENSGSDLSLVLVVMMACNSVWKLMLIASIMVLVHQSDCSSVAWSIAALSIGSVDWRVLMANLIFRLMIIVVGRYVPVNS